MRIPMIWLIAMLVPPLAGASSEDRTQLHVRLDTTMGEIVLELYPGKAPVTVENFLSYVDAGAYHGTIFHRVIPGFMVQAGGYAPSFEEREAGEPIRNEADNGLSNDRGTVAMARLSAIDSATRQFFINVADNAHLDHTKDSCTREEMEEYAEARAKGLYKPLTCENFGYAVFGKGDQGNGRCRQD